MQVDDEAKESEFQQLGFARHGIMASVCKASVEWLAEPAGSARTLQTLQRGSQDVYDHTMVGCLVAAKIGYEAAKRDLAAAAHTVVLMHNSRPPWFSPFSRTKLFRQAGFDDNEARVHQGRGLLGATLAGQCAQVLACRPFVPGLQREDFKCAQVRRTFQAAISGDERRGADTRRRPVADEMVSQLRRQLCLLQQNLLLANCSVWSAPDLAAVGRATIPPDSLVRSRAFVATAEQVLDLLRAGRLQIFGYLRFEDLPADTQARKEIVELLNGLQLQADDHHDLALNNIAADLYAQYGLSHVDKIADVLFDGIFLTYLRKLGNGRSRVLLEEKG